tara:strand:- start:1134 stop:1367 length:234 start_codon:yes stop_codon:yes gene_type:complete
MSKKKKPRLHNDGQPYISFNHMKRECKNMAARYLCEKDAHEALKIKYNDLLNRVATIQNVLLMFSEAIQKEVDEHEG